MAAQLKCPKCNQTGTILKDGFVRGMQRYMCKTCNYHFTLPDPKNRVSNPQKHYTTIIDIAKTAGVSVSTVSRALREGNDISRFTQERIKQIARNMDYQPNPLARSLHTHNTRTIGVIVPDIENHFFATIINGIQSTALAAGYNIMICQSNGFQQEIANVAILTNNWVDGILICHTKQTENADHLKLPLKRNIPVIQFDRICEDVNTSRVLLENELGAILITQHLLKQGCKKIAAVAGPKYLNITRERISGYCKALTNKGMNVDEGLIAYTNFTKQEICDAIDRWLELPEPPDGIMCISDNCAIIAMVYLKQRKIRIPQQVAVAGMGNSRIGAVIEPALTTFDLAPYRIGETAAQLFFAQINKKGNFRPKTKIIEGKLIIRNSTLKHRRSRSLQSQIHNRMNLIEDKIIIK